MPKITPETCTKEELVWWINEQLGSELFPKRFEHDIKNYREEKLTEEIDEAFEKYDCLAKEYIRALQPFAGQGISKIPNDELAKLSELEKCKDAAEKRYLNLQAKLDKLNGDKDGNNQMDN